VIGVSAKKEGAVRTIFRGDFSQNLRRELALVVAGAGLGDG